MKKRDLLEEIEVAKSSNILVIVEGVRDKKALEELGFKNIFILHGRPLYNRIEEICERTRDSIILTDFDRKGKQLYCYLKKELVKRGIRINDNLRKALLREKISHIEGLATFASHKRSKQ